MESQLQLPFPCFTQPPFAQNKQLLSLWLWLASQGGWAVSASGYHLVHILLPQHPFPDGNETVWWNQKGKSVKFTTNSQLQVPKGPISALSPNPVQISLLPWLCERTLSWACRCKGEVEDQRCSLQDLGHQGDSLSPDYMPDSWEHSLWQDSRASCLHLPAACSLEGASVFSWRNPNSLEDVPLSQTHT